MYSIIFNDIYQNDSIGGGVVTIDSSLTPLDILNALIPYIFAFAGAILMLYIIAGGFKLMTSQGKPDEVEKGKMMIANALVGLLLIFASYWILDLVGLITGSTQLQNLI